MSTRTSDKQLQVNCHALILYARPGQWVEPFTQDLLARGHPAYNLRPGYCMAFDPAWPEARCYRGFDSLVYSSARHRCERTFSERLRLIIRLNVTSSLPYLETVYKLQSSPGLTKAGTSNGPRQGLRSQWIPRQCYGMGPCSRSISRQNWLMDQIILMDHPAANLSDDPALKIQRPARKALGARKQCFSERGPRIEVMV